MLQTPTVPFCAMLLGPHDWPTNGGFTLSNYRLSDHPSRAYLAQFDSASLRDQPDEAELEITVGDHSFYISFPVSTREAPASLLETARAVLSQIAELDAVACREMDGRQEDGELFGINVLSERAVDLRYSAVSWNSDWLEMFEQDASGSWVHKGVRKF